MVFLTSGIFSHVAAQNERLGSVSTGNNDEVAINMLLNYGNGTLVWYNDTSAPSNANFYNATTIVTGGNIGAVFFASFGSHFVYSINGVGCPASNIFCDQAWGFWVLNGICWDLPSVGVDLIPVSQATTVAWFLNPASAFAEYPPKGAKCLNGNVELNPGSNPPVVDVDSREKVSVAILSTSTFDATAVNPMSVRFGRTGTEAKPVHWLFKDVNGDGRLDIVFGFRVRSTEIQPGDTQAILMGRTASGTPFRGFATILAIN